MARQQLFRAAARTLARPSSTPTYTALAPRVSCLHTTAPCQVKPTLGRRNKDDPFHNSSSATLGKPGFEHEGSQSRTDNTIVVEYPEDGDHPVEPPIQGRGGPHLKRTLAQFSLEGRVGVVTGGARGLGLVMAQSLVASGADVAIVDLNSMCETSVPVKSSLTFPQRTKLRLLPKHLLTNSRKTTQTAKATTVESSLQPRKMVSSVFPT